MNLTKQYLENLQTAQKGKDNIVHLNNTEETGDDYYIKPYETEIFVDNDSTYEQDIFLPFVGESVGMMITIRIVDAGGGGDICDQDDSLSDWSDLSYDADDEYAILYNDGSGWLKIASDM